jgi:hypothetical protein
MQSIVDHRRRRWRETVKIIRLRDIQRLPCQRSEKKSRLWVICILTFPAFHQIFAQQEIEGNPTTPWG